MEIVGMSVMATTMTGLSVLLGSVILAYEKSSFFHVLVQNWLPSFAASEVIGMVKL
jgi:hypothetical protein